MYQLGKYTISILNNSSTIATGKFHTHKIPIEKLIDAWIEKHIKAIRQLIEAWNNIETAEQLENNKSLITILKNIENYETKLVITNEDILKSYNYLNDTDISIDEIL